MTGPVGKQRENQQATYKKGVCILFSRDTKRKAIRQSVDLLKLSLKIDFSIYQNLSFFLENFHLCGTTYPFSSGTEVFSRGICDARKIANFLDKDNSTGNHYNMAGLQLFRQTFFPKA